MLTSPMSITTNEPEFGYGQLLNVLLRRFIWVGGSITVAVVIAIVSTLKEEPIYESSIRLLVEPNYQEEIDITKQDVELPSKSQTDYATQLNLMRSEAFIKETIERMLARQPQTCDKSADQSSCIKKFQSQLKLSQVVEAKTVTKIFEAKFSDKDPRIVQDFLETLGYVYLDYNKEQQEERLEKGLSLVNRQINEVESSLSQSRQALRQFREIENLIDPEQEAPTVADALRQAEQTKIDVDIQLLETQAQYAALQDKLLIDSQTALVSSRLSQSSRYQQLLNKIQETELALEQRLALYAEADPGVQDLISQRQRQISLLQQEAERVLGQVPTQFDLNEQTLLTEGQLSGIDLDLIEELVNTEVSLKSLAARQSSLAVVTQMLQTRLNNFPALISEYNRIQPEVGIQEESLVKLLQLRQELSNEIAQAGFSWDIVEPPKAGREIATPPLQNILLGIVAGFFVGSALAFTREAMDKSVRTSDQLKKQSTLPLLGIIPEIPRKTWDSLPVINGATPFPTKVFSLSQYQPFRDALDLIYKTIQLKNAQPLKSLMVTSAKAEEGKTTLSIGLALSAARSHLRVLLVDGNLRNPSLHQYFGLSNEEGISTQFPIDPSQLDHIDISPIPVNIAGTKISVLPVGPTPGDPIMFLSSLHMRSFLERAESDYDLVIVDAPAILGLADGLQLASLCQASVMVSRLDHTTQSDLTQAVTILSQINTIGIIANGYQESNYQDPPYTLNGSRKVSKKEPALWQQFRALIIAQVLAFDKRF